MVVNPLAHRVGETGLLQRHAAFGIVVVAVILAVTDLFHQFGRRIAQMQRHRLGAEFDHIAFGGLECGVGGVGFRGAGQIDHQLRQREFAFGAAQTVVGVPGVDGHLQRARIGQADVFHRHTGHASGQIHRVAAAV